MVSFRYIAPDTTVVVCESLAKEMQYNIRCLHKLDTWNVKYPNLPERTYPSPSATVLPVYRKVKMKAIHSKNKPYLPTNTLGLDWTE